MNSESLIKHFYSASIVMATLTILDGFLHTQGWLEQQRVPFSLLEMFWFMLCCLAVFLLVRKNRQLAKGPLFYVIYSTLSLTLAQLLFVETSGNEQVFMLPHWFGLVSMFFGAFYFYFNLRSYKALSGGRSRQ